MISSRVKVESTILIEHLVLKNFRSFQSVAEQGERIELVVNRKCLRFLLLAKRQPTN